MDCEPVANHNVRYLWFLNPTYFRLVIYLRNMPLKLRWYSVCVSVCVYNCTVFTVSGLHNSPNQIQLEKCWLKSNKKNICKLKTESHGQNESTFSFFPPSLSAPVTATTVSDVRQSLFLTFLPSYSHFTLWGIFQLAFWMSVFFCSGCAFVVQLLILAQLFATLWTTACQASLSSAISWSLLKFMSIELVMLSSHLILSDSFSSPQSFPGSGSFPTETL